MVGGLPIVGWLLFPLAIVINDFGPGGSIFGFMIFSLLNWMFLLTILECLVIYAIKLIKWLIVRNRKGVDLQ